MESTLVRYLRPCNEYFHPASSLHGGIIDSLMLLLLLLPVITVYNRLCLYNNNTACQTLDPLRGHPYQTNSVYEFASLG